MAVSDKVAARPLTEEEKKQVQSLVKQGTPVGEAIKQVTGISRPKETPTPTPTATPQPEKKISDKIPTKQLGAGIPIQRPTETQRAKPISFKGGMDFPPTEEPYNITREKPESAQPSSAQPAPVQPAKAPVAEAPQVKTAEVTGPKQEEVNPLDPLTDPTKYPGGTTAQPIYRSIDDVIKSLPASTIQNARTDIIRGDDGKPIAIQVTQPGGLRTKYVISTEGAVSPEEYEKKKKAIEGYRTQAAKLQEPYLTKAKDLGEQYGYNIRDYEQGKKNSMSDLLSRMDENRKRDMWEKLIEAGGKVLSGVLGITNLPFMPETKGLDIAKHYKHTPVFDRKAEDEAARAQFEAQGKDLDTVMRERADMLRTGKTKAEEAAADIQKKAEEEYMKALSKLEMGGESKVTTTAEYVPDEITTEKLWQQNTPPVEGGQFDPQALSKRQEAAQKYSTTIDKTLTTNPVEWIAPGRMPQEITLNAAGMQELNRAKVKNGIKFIDERKNEITDPQVLSKYEAWKAKRPYDAKESAQVLMDTVRKIKNGVQDLSTINGRYLKSIVTLPVDAPNEQSIKNIQTQENLGLGLPGLPTQVMMQGKSVGTTKGAPTPLQQDGAAVDGTVPAGGGPIQYPGRQPLIGTDGKPSSSSKVYSDPARIKRDMNLFLGPEFTNNLVKTWGFTIGQESFDPALHASGRNKDGSPIWLVGPGVLMKHDPTAAKTLNDTYSKFVVEKDPKKRQELVDTYRSVAEPFFIKVFTEHNPFAKYVQDIKKNGQAASFWKSNPNKKKAIMDMFYHAGINDDESYAILKKASDYASKTGTLTPAQDAEIAKLISSYDPQAKMTGMNTLSRSKARAALWMGK